jgi:hypothetical protein
MPIVMDSDKEAGTEVTADIALTQGYRQHTAQQHTKHSIQNSSIQHTKHSIQHTEQQQDV